MIDRRLQLALPCWLVLPWWLALATPAFADEHLPPSVTVNGEAREDVRPDIALVTFEIADDRAGAVEAANENARLVGAVLDGLKGSGVEAKDIATVGASIYPVVSEQRDPKTNQLIKSVVTGYHARNEIRVRLREIERAGAIIGATVQNGGLYQNIAYDLSDREARSDALRGKAAANAAHRAGLYAEGVGLRLGPLRTLSATGDRAFPDPLAMAPRAFAAAAGAPAPLQIEPGTISLSESVVATFDLGQP